MPRMPMPLCLSLLIAILSGCGGGSSNSGPPVPGPPPPTSGDRFEPNNSAAAATAVNLPIDESGLSIDSTADEDFFNFILTTPTDVQVTLRFTQANGDIDLELLDVNQIAIGTSNTSTDDERVSSFNLDTGTYTVRVFGAQSLTSNNYAISILAVATPNSLTEQLFADMMVQDLADPTVFGSGASQTLALSSRLLNIGTAPAPGSDLGNGTAEFRLRDANGAILISGSKGPIFFADNGGCSDRSDIFDQWVADGRPHIDGTVGAVSLTTPGCIDFYDAATNNGLDTPLEIGNSALMPDGNYFYELHFDAPNEYAFEPDFARANNAGAVPINISSNASGQRSVTVTGPITRGGETVVDTGTMATIVGNGGALLGLPATFPNDSPVERTWGVARNSTGEFFFTLWDDGSFCRDNGDGTSTKIIEGLVQPMVFDFFANDDVVIADHGNDRIVFATASMNYADASSLTFPGFTIVSPTAARVGPDGTVYVSNSGGHEILALDRTTGEARRVAGTGVQGFSGDGGFSDAAQLSYPIDIDITDDGLLVIADGHNNRIRIANIGDTSIAEIGGIQLLPGQIKTLAGAGPTSTAAGIFDNGTNGFRGERQHARSAIVDWPFAPRIVNGRIFFVDADNHRIRVIDKFGNIHLLTGDTPLPGGNGIRPFGSENQDVGDGGNGLNATLNRVMDIEVLSGQGGALEIDIGDTDAYRIRRQSNVTVIELPYFD